MAGAKKSKNSRMVGSNSNKRQLIGEVSLLISCNDGTHAYVLNVASAKNPHLATDSEAFLDAVKANVADGYGPKLHNELQALAARSPRWAATLARLEAAEVFALADAS